MRILAAAIWLMFFFGLVGLLAGFLHEHDLGLEDRYSGIKNLVIWFSAFALLPVFTLGPFIGIAILIGDKKDKSNHKTSED